MDVIEVFGINEHLMFEVGENGETGDILGGIAKTEDTNEVWLTKDYRDGEAFAV